LESKNTMNFWNKITSPFKKAAEKTKKTIGDFFAPVPDEVRVRDFVRELPGATKTVGTAVLNFGKDVLRAAPRAAASATLSAEGEKEFIPGSGVAPKFEKFLFGDKPIKDIRGTGEETIQDFGGSQKTAKKYGLPLGFALTALDIVPGIPKKKVAEELGEQLIKRYGDDVAKLIVEKGGKKLAEQAIKEGGEKLVEKAGIVIAKEMKPITEAVKSAEEVIKSVKPVNYFEKEGRNLMEFENADLSLPELKRKLEIAVEGKEGDELLGLMKKDIEKRETELIDLAKNDKGVSDQGEEFIKAREQAIKEIEASAPTNRTSVAESALDSANSKGHPVIKAGKKVAPPKPRVDELVPPPPTPPRVPTEVPLSGVPDSPKGSALEAIDGMVGKTSTPKNLLEWIKGVPKKFTEAFSDRFAPIKRFEEMVSDMAGKPIDINSSAYTAARMYAGRMGTVESFLNDLQKVISPLRKERADFTRFVLSRRALERAERGFANPAGVTADTAKQAMDELKTKVGPGIFKQFETAEQAIQKWADEAILRPAAESGLISKQAYNSIVAKNKHWIPFQVLDYLPDSAFVDSLPKGGEIFSVSKQGIVKGLEGTEKIIRDPFEAIIDKLSNAVNLAKRNDVARKLINIREVLPEAKELIQPLAKDARVPKGWGSISVFVDGKNTKWVVPEELSWAMHQMNEVEAGMLGNFVKFTSGAFRKGATTLYIPFSLSNAVRDAQMAVMTSKYGFNPADWITGFAQGLKGAFGWDSKLLEEFSRNGGGFGGFIQGAREISGVKKQLFEPTWWKRTKAVVNPFNLISNFAEAIELAPRLGVYKRALKGGATGFEAAFEARNATIDFAKSGQEMRIINMWVPFVNARWQALLNTARVFKESPVKASAKAGALIVAPGVTTYFWNSLNFPDLYEDVPRWIKDTYFPIIVGEEKDEQGNRVPKMVLIPKGDVGQIFYNPIEYALDYVRKGEPSNFSKLALEWMSQLAPIPFTRDGELSVTQFLSGAMPPILRTPIELATNQSFFTGGPIVPRRLEQVSPTEQYDEKTPQAAVVVGRALGVSPMKMAYGLGGLLGGFGREAIDPAKILQSTAQRFYRSAGGEKRNQAWNLKDEAVVGYSTAREQAKRAIEENNIKTATAIIENWNASAEKILPDILPYLAQDDPQEAQKISSSVTFQPQDIARLQRSVYDEQAGKAERKGTTPHLNPKLTKDSLRSIRTGKEDPLATMGQMFPTEELQQTDLKQMRQGLRQ
jgi:hypothetical protein